MADIPAPSRPPNTVTDPNRMIEQPEAAYGLLEAMDPEEERKVLEIKERLAKESSIRTHYYVKIAVSAFLCMLLLVIGVPVFLISRVTGSFSYTALGVVLVGFGLILAVAVFVMLFRPPWRK